MGATIVFAMNSALGMEAFVQPVATAKNPMMSRQVASCALPDMPARTGAVPYVRQVARLTFCKWNVSRVTRNTAQPTLASTAHVRSALTVLNRTYSKLAARHAPLATLAPTGRVIGATWALNQTATAPSAFNAQTTVSVLTGTSVNFAPLVNLHVMIIECA